MTVSKSLFMAGLLVIFLVTSQADSDTGKKSEGKMPEYLVTVKINYINGQDLTLAGTLVRKHWVVLAAPNITSIDKDNSFVMVLDYITRNFHPSKIQKCYLNKIIHHPNYNKENSNILLLKLKSGSHCSGLRSENIQPVEMNTDSNCPAANQNVTVIGWNSGESMLSRDLLYKADLKVLDSSQKEEKDLEKSGCCLHDKKTTIFAGMREGGYVGKCNGFSGGALVATCGNSANVPVGWSTCGSGCAHPERPGIFIRLSAYKKWIDDTIRDHDDNNN